MTKTPHPQAPIPLDEDEAREEAREKGQAVAEKMLRKGPNFAFLAWRDFEADPRSCPKLGQAGEIENRATMHYLREWFEELGHWRDLDPNAKDLDPADRVAHAQHKKQIDDFVRERESHLQHVEYDDVKPEHRCQNGGTDCEQVNYKWTFFRNGELLLTLIVDAGNILPPHNDPMKRHYFRNATLCGYTIFEPGDRLLEGTVFFANGEHIAFTPCFDGRVYPENLFRAGDYALRRTAAKNSSVDGVQAELREIKESTRKTAGDIADIKCHTRGVPILQADLADAQQAPMAAAMELFKRIKGILTPDEQILYEAVRKAGGIQKAALRLLQDSGHTMSAATLCRRMKIIDEKLVQAGLTKSSAAGPHATFTQIPGPVDGSGEPGLGDVAQVDRDWTGDPNERRRIIESYLAASPEDRNQLRQHYLDVDAEAQNDQKGNRVKSR